MYTVYLGDALPGQNSVTLKLPAGQSRTFVRRKQVKVDGVSSWEYSEPQPWNVDVDVLTALDIEEKGFKVYPSPSKELRGEI